MKYKKRVFAVLLALLLVLTGCKKNNVNFVWYSNEAFKTVDPQLAFSAVELTAVRHLFSGLYRLGEDGTAQPDQAVSTTISADGLTYTFELNQQAVFADAKNFTAPVTAADYVFAMQRVLNPATHSPYALTFLGISGARAVYENGASLDTLEVRAINDYTLQIKLSAADSGFLSKLATSGAMPCNKAFFDSTKGTYGLTKATVLGNGPFALTSFTTNSGLTLVKKEAISGRDIDRIRLVPADGESSAAQLLADGKQDLAVALTEEDDALLRARGLPGKHFESGVAALLFNCQNEFLSNAKIRAALADWAIESAEAYDDSALLPAEGLVPGSVLVDGLPYREEVGDVRVRYFASQRYANYQLALSEIGVSKLSQIRVLIPDSEPYLSLYRAINQDWQRELGAFFSVEQLSEQKLAARIAAGDYDIALTELSLSENSPASVLSSFLSTNPSNPCGYQDPIFDALVDQALTASASSQLTAWKNAEARLLSEAAVAPLKFTSRSIYTSAGLSGMVLDPFGPVIDLTCASFS